MGTRCLAGASQEGTFQNKNVQSIVILVFFFFSPFNTSLDSVSSFVPLLIGYHPSLLMVSSPWLGKLFFVHDYFGKKQAFSFEQYFAYTSCMCSENPVNVSVGPIQSHIRSKQGTHIVIHCVDYRHLKVCRLSIFFSFFSFS